MENSLRLAHFSVPRNGKQRFEHIDFRPHEWKIASACFSFSVRGRRKIASRLLTFRPCGRKITRSALDGNTEDHYHFGAYI